MHEPSSPSVANSTLEWGVAFHMLEGEFATGDTYVVQRNATGTLVAVIDGLGHGVEAAAPANLASALVGKHSSDPLLILVQRCHEALVGSRGVVMSLASFDYTDRTMTWIGIGDVSGVLVFRDPSVEPRRTALIHRGGIVGGRLPASRPWVIPISDGDTLVFATDGIRSEFEAALPIDGSPQAVADEIMARFAKRTDDALVLVARFLDPGG